MKSLLLNKLVNKIDAADVVYGLPKESGIVDKVIDEEVFVPIIHDLLRPNVKWVKKHAYEVKGKTEWTF